jgi:hypothetical protein
MPEIHIVFPESGAPIVCQPAEVAARREPITWCVFSANRDVKSVEVAFEGQPFFDNSDPNDSSTSRRVQLNHGQADFYGHVPEYGPLSGPMIAKYTIRAYRDADGTDEIKELMVDPVIITTQP